MGRIRTIKPEFPQSESIGRLSRDARLLFIQLWTVADDSGRTRAASRMLASLLYPYDDDAPSLMEGWLCELEQAGVIRRYHLDGDRYLEIVNWLKHQKIDRPSKSRLPPFDEGSRVFDEGSTTDLGPRTSTKDLGPKPANAGVDVAREAKVNEPYAFNGGIIRLTKKHFEDWAKSFPALDLRGELTARDAWLGSERATDNDRRNWFISTSKYLANRNLESKSKTAAMRPDKISRPAPIPGVI